MEDIENLEVSLKNNQEYVYINVLNSSNDKDNLVRSKSLNDTCNLKKKEVKLNKDSTFYENDSKKDILVDEYNDYNDSILTLNKEYDIEASNISLNADSFDNTDNETNVNAENNILNDKYRKIEDKELEMETSDVSGHELLDEKEHDSDKDFLSDVSHNSSQGEEENNKVPTEKSKINGLSIDTSSSTINNHDTSSSSSAKSTEANSKIKTSIVPSFSSFFSSTKNFRSFSTFNFPKVAHFSTNDTMNSPTTATEYGDEEVAYLLARLEAQNNLLKSDPKNSNFETLKANFQAIKDKDNSKGGNLDWGN